MSIEESTPGHHPSRDPGSSRTKAVAIYLSVAVFLSLCYFVKGVLTSLFLAFTVSYILSPAVDFIESKRKIFPKVRVPRGAAVAILLTWVFLIGSGFMAYTIPKTINGAKHVTSVMKQKYPHYQKQLEEYFGEYGRSILIDLLKGEEGKKVAPTTEEGAGGPLDFAVQFREYVPVALHYTLEAVKKLVYSTLGLVSTIADLLIFAFVSIYLLKDYNHIINELKTLIPPSRKDKILELMMRVDNNLRGFLRGQLTVSMILGLFYSLGLTILGVPMAFLVGFLGGVGNMVPYLGTFMGIALAMILTALEHSGELWRFACVGAIFASGQALEVFVLTPKIVGSKVGLHPVVMILSVLIWGQLLGLLGLLMAVPATSAAMIFGAEAVKEYREYIREG